MMKRFCKITSILGLIAVFSFTLLETQETLAKKKHPKISSKKIKKKTHAKHLETLTPANPKFKHYTFSVPKLIRPQVEFWKTVYSKYDRNYVLMHDTEYLEILYSVLNFSDLYSNPNLTSQEKTAAKNQRVNAEKERIETILLRLNEIEESEGSFASLSSDEKKIYDLFEHIPNPGKFKAATEGKRIRSQTCMKEKFMRAVATSGTYLPQMEEIFNSYDVPVEITRLVFVESMFNLKAYSKVGASGLWQFMPGTGKLYLTIDGVVDMRNDPITATHAAAKLLKSDYEALGTWPLAINAYNSGRGSLRRAIEAMGTTDIASIIKYYRGGAYQFASRNFFPSFLAASEIADNYYEYFGSIKKDPPILTEKFFLPSEASVSDLARETGLGVSTLASLNPGIRENYLYEGEKTIPVGYSINIPRGEGALFAAAMEKIAQYRLVSDEKGGALSIIKNTP